MWQAITGNVDGHTLLTDSIVVEGTTRNGYIVPQDVVPLTVGDGCIEIDLTGQVCSDSIGTKQYSGVGGQMDFMRGAALSEGGKAIIGLPSRTKTGKSRIVSFLKEGAGVVSTRAHVHYVVTEFGYVNLFGKKLRQRAHALISIAHPDDREMLDRQARDRWRKFSG